MLPAGATIEKPGISVDWYGLSSAAPSRAIASKPTVPNICTERHRHPPGRWYAAALILAMSLRAFPTMPQTASIFVVLASTMLTTVHALFAAAAKCRRALSSQRRMMLRRQAQQAKSLNW